jgi:hypothetical protein
MTNEEILFKLRQDIRLRGLSSATEEEYLMAVTTFIRFYDGRPIFHMAEQEIRNYLVYLLDVKKLTPASINVRNSALRSSMDLLFSATSIVAPSQDKK